MHWIYCKYRVTHKKCDFCDNFLTIYVYETKQIVSKGTDGAISTFPIHSSSL